MNRQTLCELFENMFIFFGGDDYDKNLLIHGHSVLPLDSLLAHQGWSRARTPCLRQETLLVNMSLVLMEKLASSQSSILLLTCVCKTRSCYKLQKITDFVLFKPVPLQ